MAETCFTVALISDVFFLPGGNGRLQQALQEARERGADLAVLPEIPLNRWAPADTDRRDEDAESPGGPRHAAQAEAARLAGIALLGGAIVRDSATGRRYNTALVFDSNGELVDSYRKLHLPEEDGFWETHHYEQGDRPPRVIDGLGMPIGVQICSDSHRPVGSYLLAALGAEAIIVPRATEPTTWERWRLVLRANAITSNAYVLSVNRPEPGLRIPLGGPSVAIAPNGRVVLETEDRLAFAALDRRTVGEARKEYPGCLPVRADVYAGGWEEVARAREQIAEKGGR